MTNLALLIVILSASLVAFAQQKTIDCSGPKLDPGCQMKWVQGKRYMVATDGVVKIAACPQTQFTHTVVSQTVAIRNISSADIDVDPAMFTGKMQGLIVPVADSQAVLAKYAHDQRRSLAWRGALAGTLMSASGNDSALATDSAGGHSVTYGTSRTTEAVNGASARIDADLSSASSKVMQRNTLGPKQDLEGAVYFAAPSHAKKHELVSLDLFMVTIGATRFIFTTP